MIDCAALEPEPLRGFSFAFPAAQDRPGTRCPCPSFTPSQIKPHSPAQTATATPAPGTAAQSERGLFAAPSQKPQEAPHGGFAAGYYPSITRPQKPPQPRPERLEKPVAICFPARTGAKIRPATPPMGENGRFLTPFSANFRQISGDFPKNFQKKSALPGWESGFLGS